MRAGVAVLQVQAPDRPGALAELTSVLAEHDVNIEDLQIVHSPEGGRGTVHLTVAATSADDALRVLASGPRPDPAGLRSVVRIRVIPGGTVGGECRVPGDKSIAHRWLILAATARGRSRLVRVPGSLDVRSTASCLAMVSQRVDLRSRFGLATLRRARGSRFHVERDAALREERAT